jgi:hypothetical protein
MKLRDCAVVLAAAALLPLAGCHRGSSADQHATSSDQPPKGATGKGGAGTAAMGGPGSGLAGGMAPPGSASQPTGVAEGSTNRSTKSSVGNR